MNCFQFVGGEGLIGYCVVHSGEGRRGGDGGGRREVAISDRDVSFGFPKGEGGMCYVPDAVELGGGRGEEGGGLGGVGGYGGGAEG